MRNFKSFYLLGVLLLAGCALEEQPKQQPNVLHEQKKEEQQVIAENLEAPWAIAKLGDTFYITERTGSIAKIESGKMERQRVVLEKELATASEAGLLGFVLAPDFQDSHLAYAYYTYVDEIGQFNRIITLYLDDDVWYEIDVLVDQIPSGTYHHGGRIKIGPDQKLYATAGDASEASLAQNLDSFGGKILRMNLDGSIPEDNPFDSSYIYSYGHRNSQGLSWLPDGTLYASEHGNAKNDEINQIQAGQNYGWPIIEGNATQQGMISPLFTSGNETTWAPSGMDYYDGKLYVAALRGKAILAFNLETGNYEEVVTGIGRIRDVYVEGDTLYFISNNTDGRGDPQKQDDKLYKILLSH
ncbi:PQQ-dependent sugar dehydrogenase [Bacillus ndiopicus]|uniref:PQQ-dependent sugar dehydrogenase n=1 Tax=Bacillus ndiopicus TaxID=1347368 RepID=UPI0005A7B87A|nr:sorbosone dehydrogenase family protein [Bacillus ndiopicus]